MSKYFVNKFLFQVGRNPALVAAYTIDPAHLVARWEREQGRRLAQGNGVEKSDWLEFSNRERTALSSHDLVALFELGGHFILTTAVFRLVRESLQDAEGDSTSLQQELADSLSHWAGSPYPPIAL
jgi:hypothetical protein